MTAVLVRISPLCRTQTPLACRVPFASLAVTSTSPGATMSARRDTAASLGPNCSSGGTEAALPPPLSKAPSRPRTPIATDRAQRARGERRDEATDAGAERDGGRTGLSSVGWTQMRSMRSGGGAAGPVVLGPHRIVVSPEVAAVAAVVVPIVGRALVVLITRGPHRCESNDATPDRDRGPRHRVDAPDGGPKRVPRLSDVPVSPPEPESRDWIVLDRPSRCRPTPRSRGRPLRQPAPS